MTRETYKGRKLIVKTDRKAQRTTALVNGEVVWSVMGAGPEIVAREAKSLRGWVDAADARLAEGDARAYGAHWYIGATA